MQNQQNPLSFWQFLPASLIFIAGGAAGLFYTLTKTVPQIGPRWLFFFCLVLAVAGLMVLPIFFLHKRFPSNPAVEALPILREAVFVGIFAAGLAWLQIGRMLSISVGLILALALILAEFLIRLWERSTWKPR
ncbi:MAG: hypothetical protein VB108_11910 [Anaerolineaceae bacterium]|nr:hypothetical protein [Anaerolineaceae bacterium]